MSEKEEYEKLPGYKRVGRRDPRDVSSMNDPWVVGICLLLGIALVIYLFSH